MYVILIAFIVGVIVLALIIAAAENRYAKMSEEEFEEEAKRASPLGAAMLGLHQILQPKRVEYILQRDKRPQGERPDSGDRPPEVPPSPARSGPAKPHSA